MYKYLIVLKNFQRVEVKADRFNAYSNAYTFEVDVQETFKLTERKIIRRLGNFAYKDNLYYKEYITRTVFKAPTDSVLYVREVEK